MERLGASVVVNRAIQIPEPHPQLFALQVRLQGQRGDQRDASQEENDISPQEIRQAPQHFLDAAGAELLNVDVRAVSVDVLYGLPNSSSISAKPLIVRL